jgi:hypothetical protein
VFIDFVLLVAPLLRAIPQPIIVEVGPGPFDVGLRRHEGRQIRVGLKGLKQVRRFFLVDLPEQRDKPHVIIFFRWLHGSREKRILIPSRSFPYNRYVVSASRDFPRIDLGSRGLSLGKKSDWQKRQAETE